MFGRIYIIEFLGLVVSPANGVSTPPSPSHAQHIAHPRALGLSPPPWANALGTPLSPREANELPCGECPGGCQYSSPLCGVCPEGHSLGEAFNAKDPAKEFWANA